jgi:hypothetical protein
MEKGQHEWLKQESRGVENSRAFFLGSIQEIDEG